MLVARSKSLFVHIAIEDSVTVPQSAPMSSVVRINTLPLKNTKNHRRGDENMPSGKPNTVREDPKMKLFKKK